MITERILNENYTCSKCGKEIQGETCLKQSLLQSEYYQCEECFVPELYSLDSIKTSLNKYHARCRICNIYEIQEEIYHYIPIFDFNSNLRYNFTICPKCYKQLFKKQLFKTKKDYIHTIKDSLKGNYIQQEIGTICCRYPYIQGVYYLLHFVCIQIK